MEKLEKRMSNMEKVLYRIEAQLKGTCTSSSVTHSDLKMDPQYMVHIFACLKTLKLDIMKLILGIHEYIISLSLPFILHAF